MSRVGGMVRESGASLRRVFANPGLRRVNLAFAGSIIGDWAYAVAISLYAYGHGGPTAVGVYSVVRYLAMATTGPLLSSLADRLPKKQVMIGADLVRCLLVGVAGVEVATGGPPISVYALSVAAAIAGTAFRPAQAALLPVLARDPSELTAANAASSTIESIGFFAGPAVAALLLAVTDLQSVFFLDALTFVWSAGLVVGLRMSSPAALPEQQAEDTDMWAELTAGFRFIGGHRDLRLLVGLFFAQTVIAGASMVFTVAIALQMLHLGHSGTGLLYAVTGIGGIVGGGLALVLAQRQRLSFDFGVGVTLWAAPLLLVAAWPTLASAVIVMALIGIGNSLVDINAFTVLQRLAPEEVMGRVFGALESALIAGMALGALLMPLLISTVGLRGGLGALGAVVTLLAVLGLPGLTRIDATTLAPPALPVIAVNPILAPLPERIREQLARSLTELHVAAGELVVEEGADGDLYYMIGQGTVEVTARGAVVNHLGPGDGFGEIALLRDVPRQATVRALEDLTLYALERDDFLRAVNGDGEANRLADIEVARFLTT